MVHDTIGRSQGFLLVELTLTLVVIVLGALGLSGAMVVAQRSQSASRDRLLASRVLSSQLEQIGNTPFTEIQSAYDGMTFTAASCTGAATNTYSARAPVVKSKVTVLDPARLGVTLTATWTDEMGARSLQLYQEFGE